MGLSSSRTAGGGRWRATTESTGNRFDDAVEVLVDLGYPESQYAKAHLSQPVVSASVVARLIAVVVAVDLDHQPRIQAGEVSG